MMLEKDATKIAQEIATEGSDLNKEYKKWVANGMTKLVVDLLQTSSTADKASSELIQVRGSGEEAATMILGFCIGKNKVITDMISLDAAVINSEENLDETYEMEDK